MKNAIFTLPLLAVILSFANPVLAAPFAPLPPAPVVDSNDHNVRMQGNGGKPAPKPTPKPIGPPKSGDE